MAWLAVDKDESEYIYEECPEKDEYYWCQVSERALKITSGSIEKLIGRKLAWTDEPVEI